jgi:hypothetical protein
VTLSVSSRGGSQAEGEVNLGPFGVVGGAQAGVSSSAEYTLYLTAEQIAQMGQGEPLPSIADPLALPVGGSMTLETGAFQNTSGGIRYGPLSLSSETGQTSGYSVAVERTGDSTVRVTVGPPRRWSNGWSWGCPSGTWPAPRWTGTAP